MGIQTNENECEYIMVGVGRGQVQVTLVVVCMFLSDGAFKQIKNITYNCFLNFFFEIPLFLAISYF